MRKSRSRSQNLFPCDQSKKKEERPRSSSRSSLRESRIPILSSLAPPQLKTSNLFNVTPLNRQRKFSTTPASTGRMTRISSSSALKERKTILHMASDKQWVATQYVKVQRFISRSELFDQSVINPNNIKPPSIKGFIYIVTVLFKQIFIKVVINQENYKEEIPKKLKSLWYPGTLTTSTLKSVNTMHSWPQVIGMLSWLIDKVEITESDIQANHSFPGEEEELQNCIKELIDDYLINKYINFNRGETEEKTKEYHDNFHEKLAKLCNCDPEEYNKLLNECMEQEKIVQDYVQVTEALVEENKKLAAAKEELKDSIQCSEQSAIEKITHLSNEISNHNKLLETLTFTKENNSSSLKNLEEKIKKQTCTTVQKKTLLEDIESLENENSIGRKKIEHARTIQKDSEIKNIEEREKLQNGILAWNNALMAPSVQKPILNSLVLSEKGLSSLSFYEIIQEIASKKKTIEKEAQISVKTMEKKRKNLKRKLSDIENEMETMEKKINEMRERIREFVNNEVTFRSETKEALVNWEKEKICMTTTFKHSQGQEQAHDIRESNEKLGKERENLKKILRDLNNSSLNCFIQLHHIITNSISYMEADISERINKLIKKDIITKNEILSQIENVEKVRLDEDN